MKKGQRHSEEAKQKLRAARAKQVHPALAERGLSLEDVAAAAARGMRWCAGRCKDFRPIGEFSSSKGPCRKCVAQSVAKIRKRWTQAERAQMAALIKGWRDENPEYERRWRLLREYGVTPEWYENKLAEQGGHCALCNMDRVAHRKYLFVDHNHETGAVRGILCYRCNTFLARVEDPNWLARALAYLQKYS